jgi:hypothetical protein
LKVEIELERIRDKGYKHPFKLQIFVFGNITFRYCALEDIVKKLEIKEQDYIKHLHQCKGKLYGDYKYTFFNNKEKANKFINEFLTPYIVAQRLRGKTKKEFGRHTAEALKLFEQHYY